jgi:hypothetical protein
MKMINKKYLITSLVILLNFSLSACSDDGDDGDHGYGNGSVSNLQFNLTNAAQILTYKGNNNTSGSSVSSASSEVSTANHSSFSNTGGQLVVIDTDGEITAGMNYDEGNSAIQVSYTIADPSKTYVYLGLSWPVSSVDSAGNNFYMCGVLRIKLSDNTFNCAAENFSLDTYNFNNGYQIKFTGKPIQFDDAGNIYVRFTSN